MQEFAHDPDVQAFYQTPRETDLVAKSLSALKSNVKKLVRKVVSESHLFNGLDCLFVRGTPTTPEEWLRVAPDLVLEYPAHHQPSEVSATQPRSGATVVRIGDVACMPRHHQLFCTFFADSSRDPARASRSQCRTPGLNESV